MNMLCSAEYGAELFLFHFLRNGINQFSRGYIQSFGKPQNHIKTRLPCSIFKRAYKTPQYINPLTKLFLREMSFKPVCS